MKIAHISDLHIASNSANFQSLAWDFALLAGPPAIAAPFLRPYLEDPDKRDELLKTLLYHSDRDKIDYRKVAAALAVSIPAAIFLIRQTLRLKRIFYLRQDAQTARDALIQDIGRQKVDHVVITGDITNVASPAEFRIAEEFVKQLTAVCGVTIIPGNHDVNIQRLDLESRLGQGKKLDRFLGSFGGLLPGNGGKFPIVRQLGDVCLLGLDSTTFSPISNAGGKVPEEQLDRLNDALHRPGVRDAYKVLLVHHHVQPGPREKEIGFKPLDALIGKAENYFMDCLSGGNDLLALARDHGVGLILHGHKHRLYSQKAGRIGLHCAGATTEPEAAGKITYNLFDWNNGTMRRKERVVSLRVS